MDQQASQNDMHKLFEHLTKLRPKTIKQTEAFKKQPRKQLLFGKKLKKTSATEIKQVSKQPLYKSVQKSIEQAVEKNMS